MSDDRYQHQPYLERCRRWWRHMPLGYCRTAWSVARWVLAGCRPISFTRDDGTVVVFGRAATLRSVWRGGLTDAEVRMKRYYTLDEVLAGIGSRTKGA